MLMKEIAVSTLEELKEQIDALIVKYGRHSLSGYSARHSVLFRGQANRCWELKSTLENTMDFHLRLLTGLPRYISLRDSPFSQKIKLNAELFICLLKSQKEGRGSW